MKRFPCGSYGRQLLTFYPAPFRAPLRAFAALVFPFYEDNVVICNIADRGWCVPSGRVEPGESSLQAVCREAKEEAGICLCSVQYIGCYRMSERQAVRWADLYAARVESFGEIEMQEESLGRQAISLDKLPEVYHLWNELTSMVFDHAYAVVKRMDCHTPSQP